MNGILVIYETFCREAFELGNKDKKSAKAYLVPSIHQ